MINIKHVYNVWAQNNKVIKGLRTEMQHLMKLLDGHKHVSTSSMFCDSKNV